ncbi:hypothetical protein QYE76_049911 [Lolium multiflorum]|uniref:RNase H type-1 domain-containing protein n=1 Tax=Lolium multiflorum TaxID=4521 RepID=A0AAD8SNW9_LOLMU|nr:hypothetical protein QYE76_049911 [Lolium multiflorum]
MKATREALTLLDIPKQLTMLPGHGWRPPDAGCVKINTDGAINFADGKGGAGGVARSSDRLIGAWSKPLLGITDPLIAESMALREGVLFARLRGISRVIMETDFPVPGVFSSTTALLIFVHHNAAEGDDEEARAKKERPPGMTNAEWAADEKRREVETSCRAERVKKAAAKRSAAAAQEEQARKMSKAFSGGGGSMFPGQWPAQGTSSSPSTFSPTMYSPSPTAMFQEGAYVQPSRFTPSPPELDIGGSGGRRGHLAGHATRAAPVRCDGGAERRGDPRDDHFRLHGRRCEPEVLHGRRAFFHARRRRRQPAARKDHVEDVADGSQAVEEDEEEGETTQAAVNLSKGKKNRKKESPPAEPRIKWTPKEKECLAEAWMTVSMNDIIGANQSFDTYWLRVKQAYEERKLVDPYFNKTNMNVYRETRQWPPIGGSCGRAANGTAYGRRSRNGRSAAMTWSKRYAPSTCITELRRALDMYTDDTGLQFKFINVYARLENCEKWKETRTTLSKSKTEQYNPDAPAACAAEGRPELGQKKLKELKRTDSPADRMQASIDKCWADLRSHADGRNDKFDGRATARHPPSPRPSFVVSTGSYLVYLTIYLVDCVFDVHCRCFLVGRRSRFGRRVRKGPSDTAVPAGTADEPVSV